MSQQGRLIDVETNLETLTGNSGGAVGPNGSGTINVVGSGTVNVAGNPGTSTLTITASASGYPITPYVVGPVGEAGYQTVQAALDAANAAGGGIVGVQPGTYTENLTLYANTAVVGLTNSLQDSLVIIDGVHTPPTTGTFGFDRIRLESATDIFNSAAAGTATLYINNGAVVITNGYIWNLPNWTGTLNGNDMGDAGSTNNGVVNNSAGAVVFLNNGVYGAGTGNTMTTNGALVRLDLCEIACPSNFTGGFLDVNIAFFTETMTLSNAVIGIIFNALFAMTGTQCLTYNTSGNFSVFQSIFDTSLNPAIGGTGAGTLELSSSTFLDNSSIAGTVTLASTDFYSGTLKTDYTNHGILLGQGTATNVVATAAPADGELLIGSTGNDPVVTTLTAGTNITISNAPGSITINATGGMTWNVVSAVSDNMVADNGYISNNAGVVTLTLPNSIAIGKRIRVAGKGAGGWAIAQNAGQTINFGSSATTTGVGGSLASTNAFDAIELLCITADTDFVALSSIGNITVV